MTNIIIFILGISIGSFLNVLIDRLARDESIIVKRSHCESCKKTLAWYDLVPVISFVALSGKCRYCRSPISFQYPIVELLTGAFFVGTFIFLVRQGVIGGISEIREIGLISYYLFVISGLIVIFFTDIKYGIISDKIVYSSILISLIYLFIIHNTLFIIQLLSALGSFLFFLVIYVATRGRGMGFGDVKLAFFMGLFLGFPKIVVALYIAFLTGAAIGIILVLWRKKKFRGGAIPFGPFLVLGTIVTLYWGNSLLQILRLVLHW